MKVPHIITISGPSLSGKTELSKLLQMDYQYNAVIFVTTRPQRAQEKDGVDYYFMNNKRYEKLSLIQKTNFNASPSESVLIFYTCLI
jgi:guanylate kinase